MNCFATTTVINNSLATQALVMRLDIYKPFETTTIWTRNVGIH
ncbi:MAG: hypothetical protein ACJZ80_05370 [Candidatus Puniceispirillales bacterium]